MYRLKGNPIMTHYTLILFLATTMAILSQTAHAQLQNPRQIPYRWKTDTTKKSVPLAAFTVAVPKGTFPVLNNPKFVPAKEGLPMYFRHEPVISITLDGQARAYPLNVLTVHEIANDTMGGEPILVTYCPLCNASVVYSRRVRHLGQEHVLHFEVSGMLRHSDMVMYDTQTESWWQQLTGEALVGKLAGTELKVIPSLVISVAEFFQRYPHGQILSRNTGVAGAERSYGTNPYAGYDQPGNTPYDVFIKQGLVDKRLPAMERVVDVESKGKRKIYPFSAIAKKGVVNDSFEGKHIVIFYTSGTVSVLDERDISRSRKVGTATLFNAVLNGRKLTFLKKGNDFVDEQTGSVWDVTGRSIAGPLQGRQLPTEPHSNHLAFAWLAFYPDSEIYK
ncbi:DUF3179 domain-containing protein [Pontibacter sp. E15-1]|uniref:DUF3179 domain-containing protein n=1 Tax=Pontibacter sp. E15-1 TaxID=2919918 RepID=UPI001F4F8A64|nr:DUF3179 domain-containing protein [Pontibacter sp. E15-1]MCJ8163219.1 DUF3179 domain-containing protein [Pontibacter sp. E15-1]